MSSKLPSNWKSQLELIAENETLKNKKKITLEDLVDRAFRSVLEDAILSEYDLKPDMELSFPEFSKKYFKIVHPRDGAIPFELYPHQNRLFEMVESERFVIGSKFRQGGFDTLMILYGLWKCMTCLDQSFLFLFKTDREACYHSLIVKKALDYLPNEMKAELITDNDHNKVFANGSRMSFYTPAAACGKSIKHLVISEAAFIENMEQHWKAMYPTISCGGKVTCLSSINNNSDWFIKTLIEAHAETNSFSVYECDFREHPEYNNEAWIAETKKNLGNIGWNMEMEQCMLIDNWLVKPSDIKGRRHAKNA